MGYTYYHRPIQLLQADMGLDGADNVDAGETVEIGESSRETSDGTTRVVSTGETRSVTGIADLQDFSLWIKLEATTGTNLVLDAGCEVVYGDAPPEDTEVALGTPLYAPFTKIITKDTGGPGRAVRFHKRN